MCGAPKKFGRPTRTFQARATIPETVYDYLWVPCRPQAAELLTSVEALYREGETLYESGRLEEAEAKFAAARQTLMRSEEALFFQPNVEVAQISRRGSRRFFRIVPLIGANPQQFLTTGEEMRFGKGRIFPNRGLPY